MRAPSRTKGIVALLVALLAGGAWVVFAWHGGAQTVHRLDELATLWIGWTSSIGPIGMAVFALLSALATVFLFPGSLYMTASGAAFGLVPGFLTAQVGAMCGAVLAFCVSRYAGRIHVERLLATRPRFETVDRVVEDEGWRMVLLTRCCPVFPFVFQNYAYGLTRVRFSHYAVGSFVGLLPATLLFAYVGALGRRGIEAAAGDWTAGVLESALQIFGLVATVITSVYITRASRRALRRAGV